MRFRSVVAPAQQPPAPVAPEKFLSSEVEQGVLVPQLQNLLGGLAVTVAVEWLIYLVWWRDVPPLDALAQMPALPGLTAGVLVWCVATVVRAFRDESGFLVAKWAERHDAARAVSDRAQLDALRAQVRELETRSLVSNRYAAQETAERILADWYEKRLPTSRAECLKRGMTRPDWDAAMKILRGAGVIGDNGQVLLADPDEAWRRVVRQQAASRSWQRTADGDFTKV